MINQMEAIGHAMQTIFISDLHLSEENPETRQYFLTFLQQYHPDELYILGDFFEAWIGDDYDAPWVTEICDALKENGTKIYFMQGNRDFLLGERFARRCHATLLQDPTVIDVYGVKVLLTHGDILCTEDHAYQRYRKIVHCTLLQKLFLCLPLRFRQKIAQKLRQKSGDYVKGLPFVVMDVAPEAVSKICAKHQVKHIIHGHTHKPFVHQEAAFTRYVLPDWHHKGGVLVASPQNPLELRLFK